MSNVGTRWLSHSAVGLLLSVLVALSLFLTPLLCDAAVPNQLQRIDIKKKNGFTRITISASAEPKFSIAMISGNRLRIRLQDTQGRLFKPLRRYSDSNIGGIVCSQRGNDMQLIFAVAANHAGWRSVHVDGVPALSVDVGPPFLTTSAAAVLPGRERIRGGAEKLLNDFDPPIRPEIPFLPTKRQDLKPLLGDAEQQQFLVAEGELYKERLTAAEETFAPFVAGTSPVRPLALYRLGEAQYRLQKYAQALVTFREAVKEWPDYMVINPAVMFYYGDSIARSGDLQGGRQLLAKLIVANADKKYSPILLVRMADVLARQGDIGNARALYTTVSEAFRENKAHQIARVKLADRAFFTVNQDTYQPLSDQYAEIAATTNDFGLREEATFKHALLEAINGPVAKALKLTVTYQKRFPRGVYTTVVRDIREDLVALVYRSEQWGENPAELIRLAMDNREYLATVIKHSDFLPDLSAAFEKQGHPLELIELYSGLINQASIGEDARSYMTVQVADQAELLGDTVMVRKTLEGFLLRHPTHEKTRWAKERLAAIQFAAKEMAAVRSGITWLLQKNEHALFPASYYYLGRAFWDAKESARAGLAMELYLAATRGTKEAPPLITDAYYVAASARQSRGDRKGASALLEEGVKRVPPAAKDQLLYKLGEIAVHDGRMPQARAFFEQIIKQGKDPDWQRLARQALEDGTLLTPQPVMPRKK